MPDSGALVWENQVVLATVQALLGLASAQMSGVAVEIDGETITLHFAVEVITDELAEDIAGIGGDLEGLLHPRAPDVRCRIFHGETNGGWDGRQHRLVYLAKGHGV